MKLVARWVLVVGRVVTEAVDLAAVAVVATLLARLALHIPHPKAWAAWRPIRALVHTVDPLLVATAKLVGVPWSARGGVAFVLPLLLVGAVLAVRAMIVASAHRAQRPAARYLADRPESERAVATHPPQVLGAAGAGRAAPQPAPGAGPVATTLFAAANPVAAAVGGSMAVDDATLGPTAARAELAGAFTKIGRYTLSAELGRGAMGVVYKAHDPQIGRTVAIKSILSASLPEDALALFKERFAREARAAGQLSHPRIVAVYDLLEDAAGQPCMVMEFVDGPTLSSLGRRGEVSLERALEMTLQAAQALDYAHGRGVVHRDIKPANILVDGDGRIKITDFGIAKMPGTRLTQTGQIMGTPAYMSPEQFTGGEVDRRADIFSLGAVLYWLCTGGVPFPGDTITAVASRVLQSEPAPARQLNPDLPEEVEAILVRCLAKDPAKRYATGRLLAADLEAYLAGRPLADVEDISA